MPRSAELLQGTLDLLILKVLTLQPMHGWAIAQRIRQLSNEILRVNQGALYPALHRLEHQAWIESSWGESENNRRAKYYSLTKAGRKRLEAEEQSWDRLSAAVQGVLKAV
jgi:PadR family transcriptional regulator, regulatory protein PadR